MDHDENNKLVDAKPLGGAVPDGLSPSPVGMVQQPPPPVPYEKKEDKPEPSEATKQEVKKWVGKINHAKKKFDQDFQRMKNSMEFVFGLQWAGQEDLDDDRYVANIVLREINQGVASLYARNPKATAERRERMDFTVWDGTPETLISASQQLMGGMPNPLAFAIIQDFLRVETERQLIDKVAKTLETVYQIQLDRQEPDFKLQMKQLVRRIKVCGVGYVRAVFKREDRVVLTPTQTYVDVPTRLKRLTSLVDDFQSKKFDNDNAKFEEIQQLTNSLSTTFTHKEERAETVEKLVFDFPPATSVIVDPKCRMLKGFVGAKWVVQEYILPLDDVKSFFEVRDLSPGTGEGQAKLYTAAGDELASGQTSDTAGTPINVHVAVWEVFDKTTRQRFFLCDGYHNYLLPPEEPTPAVQRFWHLIAITFNDTETEPGLNSTIYPPSDVDLLRHPQVERNRSRQGLTEHRRTNRPATVSPSGALNDEDKTLLKSNYPVGSNIELRGMSPGQKVTDFIQPLPHNPIDPALYTTEPIDQDVLLVSGTQQANLGPISTKGTATEASISEQSRLSVVGSNVDDLDDLLTEMANVGGEMLLREMSQETIKQDVGPGAVWPIADRDKFTSRILLKVAAASTGRPNKGVEIANFERLAPLFIQLLHFLPPQEGAQLISFLIREATKRLDDRIDMASALPLLNNLKMMIASSGGPPGQGAPPSQPGRAGPGGGQGPGPQHAPAANEHAGGPPIPLSAQTDAASAGVSNAS